MTTPSEKTTTPEDEFGARSFAVFLRKIADGDCENQLSDELLTLMKAVAAQSKQQVKAVSGTLTLSLKFVGDEQGVVNVAYDIKRAEPKPKRPKSVFWLDKNSNIVDQNPKQLTLGMRDVSKGKGPAREAPANNETREA